MKEPVAVRDTKFNLMMIPPNFRENSGGDLAFVRKYNRLQISVNFICNRVNDPFQRGFPFCG